MLELPEFGIFFLISPLKESNITEKRGHQRFCKRLQRKLKRCAPAARRFCEMVLPLCLGRKYRGAWHPRFSIICRGHQFTLMTVLKNSLLLDLTLIKYNPGAKFPIDMYA